MKEFDLKQFEPYLFILIGVGVILYAVFKKRKWSILKNSGEKAEGIIYELNQEAHSNVDVTNHSNPKNRTKVRFVTKKDEWITGDVEQEFALFFTGQYKAGERIDVYYDRDNPSKFFVDTKQSENLARILFIVIGLIFSSIGVYMLNS